MTEQGVAHLFSYGTLRQPEVQRVLFGRELQTTPDALPGFELATVRITDPAVVATSGSDTHPILKRSADPGSLVPGAALAVTPDDVVAADAYEVDDYQRIVVVLRSGLRAYVYVARDEVT
ncbi:MULTISPECIES: gamma-glutamylcyclotransferase family protein [unclassified Phenylobacterium]|uniref:gamma-glutamylcyclotransferase family protein n=1 Tax=unclassified Phenylobacterium TaxID=2640670 RepID=UPI00083A0E16|nr:MULTISPECIES: gamma-glutamylcyclotransferase family protein [unclassified Phenylobacterium]